MIYLNSIIEAINSQIRTRLSAYPKMLFAGIADYKYDQSKEGSVIISPVIVGFGEKKATNIQTGVNTISAYHRLGLTTVSIQPGQDYGDGKLVNNKYSTELQLLVIGTTDQLNVFPYDFAGIIADSFPLSMSIQEGIKFDTSLSVTSIQHDKRANFNQEFSGVNYFMGPEYFFFSIRYRIEATYLNGCTNICDC